MKGCLNLLNFRYEFLAEPAGTHFWHSHTQMQRGDGLYGGFNVKQAPETEPLYDLYDHDCPTPSGDCEHTAIIADWFHEVSLSEKSCFNRLRRCDETN